MSSRRRLERNLFPEELEVAGIPRLVERGDHRRIERFPREGDDLVDDIGELHGLLVRAVGRHRVEGVGHGDDPRDERDALALQSVRVAAAGPRLVVERDGRDDLAELRNLAT